MKYLIIINQKAIISKNYKLDLTDAAILSFLIDFCRIENTKSKRIEFRNRLYFWLTPERFFEEMPIIPFRSARQLRRRLNRLEKLRLIHRKYINTGTKKECYLSLSPEVMNIIFDSFFISGPQSLIPTVNPDQQVITPKTDENSDKTNRKPSSNFVNIYRLIDHFFTLKNWTIPVDMKTRRIKFSRWTRPASDVLYLCGQNLEKAKKLLDTLEVWAKIKNLDWNLSTILKRWEELDKNQLIDKETLDNQKIDEILSRYK